MDTQIVVIPQEGDGENGLANPICEDEGSEYDRYEGEGADAEPVLQSGRPLRTRKNCAKMLYTVNYKVTYKYFNILLKNLRQKTLLHFQISVFKLVNILIKNLRQRSPRHSQRSVFNYLTY